mgnify:CR=1 FL=1
MKTSEFIFWDICDFLAGDVERPAAAHAFILSADKLAETGVNYWQESKDYKTARQTVDKE